MHFATLLTAVGTAIFAVSGVQAAGNFAASCSNYYIRDNNFLWATCGNGNGGQTTSALNLNSCIGNDGRNLVCRANGNYATACSGCLIRTGTYMLCGCSSGSGIADLNECVANRGGLLTCA
ncbi:unnamed protein product [Rhizoctonia solani]|uniref:Cyanovirin-N domain-containing protein n=1 Tax=Rhizoctonia solani TaxID=456999 RepID=A0A8H3D8I2_9AGAM|nr:unnamed protein product [Rhizoctonia solani]CAE7175725.1 unnamed protein product [Rhizoctonia solani]